MDHFVIRLRSAGRWVTFVFLFLYHHCFDILDVRASSWLLASTVPADFADKSMGPMSREMLDSEDIFGGKTNMFSQKNHFRFATA